MRWVVGINEVGRVARKQASLARRYIIGIDEVGRGSLAGPVTVAAVCIPKGLRIVRRELGSLKDSKKLSAAQRERWSKHIKNHQRIRFTIARVYPRSIERMNISAAANIAALRAFLRLSANCDLKPKTCAVYLDGGLYLGSGRLRLPARTVVKGDEKITAIKLASIVAKVHRDRHMTRLARKHPKYGFEIHKGYGTKSHRAAIKKHGVSQAHRLTFLKKSITM